MDASQTPPELTERKNAIRAEMRARLSALTDAQRSDGSASVCGRLVKCDAFARATTVMLYMPMRSEIDILPVALEAFRLGKSVCVPRVESGRKAMHAIATSTFDDESMGPDELGVRTPKSGTQLPPEAIDLVVVPGVAFDTRGFRLGRGGGYYDRFLARLARHTATIGVCFDFQFVDTIPTETTDVAVQSIVSDRRRIETHNSQSTPPPKESP